MGELWIRLQDFPLHGGEGFCGQGFRREAWFYILACIIEDCIWYM